MWESTKNRVYVCGCKFVYQRYKQTIEQFSDFVLLVLLSLLWFFYSQYIYIMVKFAFSFRIKYTKIRYSIAIAILNSQIKFCVRVSIFYLFIFVLLFCLISDPVGYKVFFAAHYHPLRSLESDWKASEFFSILRLNEYCWITQVPVVPVEKFVCVIVSNRLPDRECNKTGIVLSGNWVQLTLYCWSTNLQKKVKE